MFKILLTFLLILGSMGCTKKESLIPSSVIDPLRKSYSQEENTSIDEEMKIIDEKAFSRAKKQKHYLGTAGGPGACKSTILEKRLLNQDHEGGYAYLDPDRVALLSMKRTFGKDRQNNPKAAYKKWRDASNFITNTLLNKAFEQGYNIAHGTTGTGASVGDFYKKLKQDGYTISLILCSSPEDARLKAIQYRDEIQKFVQSTHEDIINKGKMFFDRFPVYAEYADDIEFYWTDYFKNGSIKAATWTREKGLVILDSKAFAKLEQDYNSHKKEGQKSFQELFPPKK